MKQRLGQFDFIRAISALSVIAIHITSSYVLSNDIGYVWNQTMRYAVPMFIIISGFLLYYSDKQKDKFAYLSFMNKRLSKILIPYFLWTVIYTIYIYRDNMNALASNSALINFFKHLVFGLDHLYFVVIILQLYILYPFLKVGFLKGYDKLLLILSLIMTFYFQLGSYLLRWDIIILPKQILGFYYVLFPCWIFFFVFGMYLVTSHDIWKEKIHNHSLDIAMIWFIGLGLLIVESKITNTYESSMKPIVIVYSVITFFLFYLMSACIIQQSIKHKIIIWISEQSFVIYLSHILIMKIVHALAYRIGFMNVWDSFEGMILFFIATVSTTFAFARIISMTSLATLLGGVPIASGKNAAGTQVNIKY